MCFNCGDFINDCWQDECYNPNGGPFGKSQTFYIGSRYCRHLQAQYGHEVAVAEDRYGVEESDDPPNLTEVIDEAVRRWGPALDELGRN